MLNSLSGRFLVLTIVFVMLAEVLIFVPSISRFRLDYLAERLERAQIASLALLADDMLDTDLEAELLQNAGVYNVVLRRDEVRQLMLSSPIPEQITNTYDLRDAGPWILIRDAMTRIFTTGWANPDMPLLMILLTGAVWVYQWLNESPLRRWLEFSWVRIGMGVAMILYLFLFSSGGGDFIYFQF